MSHVIIQTYMRKLDAQKNGTGGKEFEFLEKNSSVKAPEYDHGMTQEQILAIEDTEEV